jgi:Undecaprenyl-phosphate galactose phosphotransferase WbaP
MTTNESAIPATIAASESVAQPAEALAQPTSARWWARALRIAILMLVDAMALVAAASLAYQAWAHAMLRQPVSLYTQLLPLVLVFLLNFAKGGLYPGFGIGPVETLRQLTVRISFVFVVLASASFIFKLPHQYSRMTFVITWALALLLVPLARVIALSVLRRTRWWSEPAVLIGPLEATGTFMRSLDSALTLGYRPVARLSTEPGRTTESVALPVGSLSDMETIAATGVRVAVMIGASRRETSSLLQSLQRHFTHVIDVRGLEAPVYGVAVRDLGGVLGLEYRNQLLLRHNMVIKRALDIAGAAAGLVVTAPVLLAAALLVKVSSRGPVLFRQQREGLEGKPFELLKLRTMYVDAEDRLQRHLAAAPHARSEWERGFKLARDPRIVPFVGWVLRRSSIDELPQLWNILRGHMSLVGPRPFPEYHLAGFGPSFRALRRRVRPGLSGYWQVTIRSNGSLREQEEYDTYYIRNWSLWLDAYILARTFLAVATGRGAC